MRGVLISFPLAVKTIIKDPVNIMLFLVPTIIALLLYISIGIYIITHGGTFTDYIQSFLPENSVNTFLSSIVTFFLVLFVLILMNWTFVIFVGVIASPFNDMLSSRIEKKLALITLPSREQTMKDLIVRMGETFTNEFKKIFFILVIGSLAFIMNYIPMLYPLALVLSSLLLAVQFIDYSWSRHQMPVRQCLIDLLRNFFPYSIPGFIFLLFISVPIINAFVPAFATSYFTVLWLYRQNKINPSIRSLLES